MNQRALWNIKLKYIFFKILKMREEINYRNFKRKRAWDTVKQRFSNWVPGHSRRGELRNETGDRVSL